MRVSANASRLLDRTLSVLLITLYLFGFWVFLWIWGSMIMSENCLSSGIDPDSLKTKTNRWSIALFVDWLIASVVAGYNFVKPATRKSMVFSGCIGGVILFIGFLSLSWLLSC